MGRQLGGVALIAVTVCLAGCGGGNNTAAEKLAGERLALRQEAAERATEQRQQDAGLKAEREDEQHQEAESERENEKSEREITAAVK